MTREELIQLLSVDNCEDINSEELPVEDDYSITWIFPNIPTFLEAILKIKGIILIEKSEQWLYIGYTGDPDTWEGLSITPKVNQIAKALISHLNLSFDESLSHSTMMKAYNNNPIDLTTI